MPMSSPGTILAAGLLLSPNRNIKIATKMQNPYLSTQDEVPVDVVTDRLLCHLALGTYGCVHAVSGVKSRMGLEEWRKQLSKLRRIPWGLQPQWIKEDWSSPNQHPINQLYKILATSFAFSESRTMAILQELRGKALPDRQEKSLDLQLFTQIDMCENYLSRVEGIRYVLDQFSRKSRLVQLLVWFYPSDFGESNQTKNPLLSRL